MGKLQKRIKRNKTIVVGYNCNDQCHCGVSAEVYTLATRQMEDWSWIVRRVN